MYVPPFNNNNINPSITYFRSRNRRQWNSKTSMTEFLGRLVCWLIGLPIDWLIDRLIYRLSCIVIQNEAPTKSQRSHNWTYHWSTRFSRCVKPLRAPEQHSRATYQSTTYDRRLSIAHFHRPVAQRSNNRAESQMKRQEQTKKELACAHPGRLRCLASNTLLLSMAHSMNTLRLYKQIMCSTLHFIYGTHCTRCTAHYQSLSLCFTSHEILTK